MCPDRAGLSAPRVLAALRRGDFPDSFGRMVGRWAVEQHESMHVSGEPGNGAEPNHLTADSREQSDAQARLGNLLDAVISIGSDLDLAPTLLRIVRAACALSGARYGALGVVAPDGQSLEQFITHGMTDEQIEAIGSYPRGHGVLGLLIADPQSLVLHRLDQHPDSYGFPARHPVMQTFLGVPIRIRDRVFGNLYLTEKAGGADFTDADERAVSALAVAAGVVIDNARLYADTDRRRRWHQATARITQLLLGNFTTTEALTLIATEACSAGDAAVAAVLLPDAMGNLGVAGLSGRTRHSEDADGSTGPQSTAMDRAVALADYLDDVEDRARPFAVDDISLEAAGRALELAALGRTTIVPFRQHLSDDSGVLVVAYLRNEPRRSDDSVELISTFAAQAGLALDRAQSLRDRVSLAVLQDRDRIARDLHDLVIQHLFATGLGLQAVQRLAPPAVADRIASAVQSLDATITEVRSTIFELRRASSGSLRRDLSALVADSSGILGFSAVLTVHGPIDSATSDRTREHILATVRESLTNIVKHAHATTALVEVGVEDSYVYVRVLDDGVGVDRRVERLGGLRNLRERAAELGGEMNVRAGSPTGTVVELRAPVS